MFLGSVNTIAMIRITVELLPRGSAKDKKVLGVMNICNDATGTPTRGNYKARIFRRNSDEVWKEGRVVGFPRKSKGPWDLLLLCLLELVKDRNKKQIKEYAGSINRNAGAALFEER